MSNNDATEGAYSGEIDPEIAELIGIDEDSETQPDFNDLFSESVPADESGKDAVDLDKKTFPVIDAIEGPPRPFFQDRDFYKNALGGEGEPAKRFHKQLSDFLNSKDPEEKSALRGKLVSAFWHLAESIACKSHVDLPDPKRVILRYGAALPRFLSAEQRTMLEKIIFENNTGEPVHYVDEWLHKIATGSIGPSATDEVKVRKKDDGANISAHLEKARGNRDAHLGTLAAKFAEITDIEGQLKDAVARLCKHERSPVYPDIKLGYSLEQRALLPEIGNLVRQLGAGDKEIERLFTQLDNATGQLDALHEKAEEAGVVQSVDAGVVEAEFNTVRQMAKLCVGRQGNHMPILMKQYFRANIRDIGTRENVILGMAAVEALDPGVFLRTFKRQTNRIVPYVILIPSYGDEGICWEPFERYNRATSRGRIAIPMFPKDLKVAIIAALADLRWQVAKEKAQHYWMEEGLTGHYYQWFDGKKQRGDVKAAFIRDYILWITRESEGTQKLDRDVRGIFWRHIPFPQAIKDTLKNRGFVYSELYKKDRNREASDGY